jgi:glutaconyl-CoA/methylmalonyl-CoA decarboxylase subunit delta
MIFKIIAQVNPSTLDAVSKAKIQENSEHFTKIDPWGLGMTFIGMAVVFLSLLLLYILFLNITKILNVKMRKTFKKEGNGIGEEKEISSPTGEINAAIAMALHLYMSDLHDQESAVLTINRVARTYSPWSSKIYGLRQHQR